MHLYFRNKEPKQGKLIGAVAWVWIPKNVSYKVASGTRLGSLAVVQSHNNVLVPPPGA